MKRLCIAFLLSLSGCVSVLPELPEVVLAEQVWLRLGTVPTTLTGQSWQQVIKVTRPGHSDTVLAQLAIGDDGELRLNVMSVQGIPLFELTQGSDGSIASKRFVPAAGLEPEYVLADIALVHWPQEALRGMLSGAVLNDKQGTRTVETQTGAIIRIEYLPENTRLSNLARAYQLEFTRVD